MRSQQLRSPGTSAGSCVLVASAAVAGGQPRSACRGGSTSSHPRAALFGPASEQPKETGSLELLCCTNPSVNVWSSVERAYLFFFLCCTVLIWGFSRIVVLEGRKTPFI